MRSIVLWWLLDQALSNAASGYFKDVSLMGLTKLPVLISIYSNDYELFKLFEWSKKILLFLARFTVRIRILLESQLLIGK